MMPLKVVKSSLVSLLKVPQRPIIIRIIQIIFKLSILIDSI